MRYALGLFLVVFSALGAFIGFVIWGLFSDSRASVHAALFNGIIDRAIQIDRVGHAGFILNEAYNGEPSPRPVQYENVRAVLERIDLSGASLDCAVGIVLPSVDVTQVDPAVGAVFSMRPFQFVAVFSGPAPDLGQFFSESNGRRLMAPISLYYPLMEGRSPPRPEWTDLRDEYDSVMRGNPGQFAWQAVECGTFSYVEVLKK